MRCAAGVARCYGRAVSEPEARPLLFLDVDGTVLPVGDAKQPLTLEAWYAEWQHPDNPQLAAIDPSLGPRLLGLGCELWWATAWMDDANPVIAPLLGVPALPVARMGELPDVKDEIIADDDERAPLSWKTTALVALAAGRPFIWLDDELTETDRTWVAENHPGPALLLRVDSTRGLRHEELDGVAAWIGSLATEAHH